MKRYGAYIFLARLYALAQRAKPSHDPTSCAICFLVILPAFSFSIIALTRLFAFLLDSVLISRWVALIL